MRPDGMQKKIFGKPLSYLRANSLTMTEDNREKVQTEITATPNGNGSHRLVFDMNTLIFLMLEEEAEKRGIGMGKIVTACCAKVFGWKVGDVPPQLKDILQ